jgi:hypothetical protein
MKMRGARRDKPGQFPPKYRDLKNEPIASSYVITIRHAASLPSLWAQDGASRRLKISTREEGRKKENRTYSGPSCRFRVKPPVVPG